MQNQLGFTFTRLPLSTKVRPKLTLAGREQDFCYTTNFDLVPKEMTA